MALKKYSPVTPGLRFRVANVHDQVTTSTPEKSLVVKKNKSGGRNHDGKMTMRYLGGGHKQKYRIIDFKRDKDNIPATIKTIEYDPNRTAYIALLNYKDGEKRYIIAPKGLKVGDVITSGEGVAPEIGNTLFFKDMPLGTTIHNIEMSPGKGAAIVRSAGTSAQLSAKEGKYAVVKLPSGESRMILLTCRATVGVVSNGDHNLQSLGKAGRTRWKGRRPRVRGVAMNPVDHPMGGGEGKSSGGHPRSRNGLISKGKKTRDPNNPSTRLIIGKKKKK